MDGETSPTNSRKNGFFIKGNIFYQLILLTIVLLCIHNRSYDCLQNKMQYKATSTSYTE